METEEEDSEGESEEVEVVSRHQAPDIAKEPYLQEKIVARLNIHSDARYDEYLPLCLMMFLLSQKNLNIFYIISKGKKRETLSQI